MSPLCRLLAVLPANRCQIRRYKVLWRQCRANTDSAACHYEHFSSTCIYRTRMHGGPSLDPTKCEKHTMPTNSNKTTKAKSRFTFEACLIILSVLVISVLNLHASGCLHSGTRGEKVSAQSLQPLAALFLISSCKILMNDRSLLATSLDNNIALTAPTPITIISGFLGAGKTSLLSHLLSADHGKKSPYW